MPAAQNSFNTDIASGSRPLAGKYRHGVLKRLSTLARHLLISTALLMPMAAAQAAEEEPDLTFEPLFELLEQEPVFTETVKGEKLTIKLDFMHLIPGEQGQTARPWDKAARAPFVKGVKRWMEIIKGVKNKAHHELTVRVAVFDLKDYANGVADLHYDELVITDGNILPTLGYIAVHKDFYLGDPKAFGFPNQKELDQEFDANILHELGHVFGIGTLWNLHKTPDGFIEPAEPNNATYRNWVTRSKSGAGYSYQKPNSAAVKAFNTTFHMNLSFLPATQGHLYNASEHKEEFKDTGIRKTHSGEIIPSMSEELMGHGMTLSSITIGLLDDLGWDVNYSTAEPLPQTVSQ
ncbi:hypothetical protein [Coralliovum pocilloporae]|uniref:hypothetical protein n=1 Tax=Coralliovum pocilloporae TaxID=3066369 RepID=UPI003307310A